MRDRRKQRGKTGWGKHRKGERQRETERRNRLGEHRKGEKQTGGNREEKQAGGTQKG